MQHIFVGSLLMAFWGIGTRTCVYSLLNKNRKPVPLRPSKTFFFTSSKKTWKQKMGSLWVSKLSDFDWWHFSVLIIELWGVPKRFGVFLVNDFSSLGQKEKISFPSDRFSVSWRNAQNLPLMYPVQKRHKSHTKGLFILAERRVENVQWLPLRAELDNNQGKCKHEHNQQVR